MKYLLIFIFAITLTQVQAQFDDIYHDFDEDTIVEYNFVGDNFTYYNRDFDYNFYYSTRIRFFSIGFYNPYWYDPYLSYGYLYPRYRYRSFYWDCLFWYDPYYSPYRNYYPHYGNRSVKVYSSTTSVNRPRRFGSIRPNSIRKYYPSKAVREPFQRPVRRTLQKKAVKSPTYARRTSYVKKASQRTTYLPRRPTQSPRKSTTYTPKRSTTSTFNRAPVAKRVPQRTSPRRNKL